MISTASVKRVAFQSDIYRNRLFVQIIPEIKFELILVGKLEWNFKQDFTNMSTISYTTRRLHSSS